MLTPVAAAFATLALHWNAPANCLPPQVMWSSLYVNAVCQVYAKPQDVAKSCYDPSRVTIILPDGWDEHNHDDEKLLYHEMDRHVEQACLHHVFTEAEPQSVIDAEELAP